MATQLFHTQSTDVTWLFIGSSTWTAVEVNIGIVSGVYPLSNLGTCMLTVKLNSVPPVPSSSLQENHR